MAVDVVSISPNAALKSDSYEKATSTGVQEGHLYVRDAAKTVVAVYAPGTWHHADVKD